MSAGVFQVLQRQIVENVTLKALIPRLNQERLLAQDEEEFLTNNYLTEYDRVLKLTSILSKKGPDAPSLFVKCLRNEGGRGHLYLAGVIESHLAGCGGSQATNATPPGHGCSRDEGGGVPCSNVPFSRSVASHTDDGSSVPQLCSESYEPVDRAWNLSCQLASSGVLGHCRPSQSNPENAALHIPPSLAASQVPPSLATSQVPPCLAASQVPPSLAASQIPPSLSALQVPPSLATSQVPPSLTALQVPPTSQVPPSLATSQVPPSLTASQVPPLTASQVASSPCHPLMPVELPQMVLPSPHSSAHCSHSASSHSESFSVSAPFAAAVEECGGPVPISGQYEQMVSYICTSLMIRGVSFDAFKRTVHASLQGSGISISIPDEISDIPALLNHLRTRRMCHEYDVDLLCDLLKRLSQDNLHQAVVSYAGSIMHCSVLRCGSSTPTPGHFLAFTVHNCPSLTYGQACEVKDVLSELLGLDRHTFWLSSSGSGSVVLGWNFREETAKCVHATLEEESVHRKLVSDARMHTITLIETLHQSRSHTLMKSNRRSTLM